MKKILAFIGILLMGLFVLSGCEGDNNVGPSTTPFVGGVTALKMSFIPGAPPLEVFDNSQFPFSVNIKLENLGEHTIESGAGYIELTGIDPKEFNKNSQNDLTVKIPEGMDGITEMRGVRKNSEGTILIGDTFIAEINQLKYTPNIRGNFDARIRATACYDYTTSATTYVCIKRDMLTNINTKEICSVTGVKTVHNSGAPIQINKVEQIPLGSKKIQLTFEIAHVGTPNDRFYKEGTACDDSAMNLNKNKVYFKINDPTGSGIKDVSCSGLQEGSKKSEGYVELFSGAPRVVVCSFDLDDDIRSVFEKQINVDLRYRYGQFIEQSMLIKDVSSE
jgi:hypothetical protein